MRTPQWTAYLDAFHTQRPGITEAVLERARDGHQDAYDWLAEAVPPAGAVLDLACGNAVLWSRLPARTYIGLDSNAGELAAARARGAPHLMRAHAASLPVAAASVDAVTVSMALQILAPLPVVLAETSRVLRAGGLLVATVPARGPVRSIDLPVLAGLLTTLGRGLSYPNDHLLRRSEALFEAAGLTVCSDESRLFRYPLGSAADAELLLSSLYLPELPRWRRRAALAYLRTLARAGVRLPVPIRRIVAQRR